MHYILQFKTKTSQLFLIFQFVHLITATCKYCSILGMRCVKTYTLACFTHYPLSAKDRSEPPDKHSHPAQTYIFDRGSGIAQVKSGARAPFQPPEREKRRDARVSVGMRHTFVRYCCHGRFFRRTSFRPCAPAYDAE